jgi:3-methyladenine DNA glycosylase AlkD
MKAPLPVRDAIVQMNALRVRNVPAMRRIRRNLSAALRNASADEVMAAADELKAAGMAWVGFEVVYHHSKALRSLTIARVERLGAGMASWGEIDAFGGYIAGPAWLRGQISDANVRRWTKSRDRWWRRTALVATTVLNTKSKGGVGDAQRTLDVAARLCRDPDDMVVKALSWSLRSLVPWNRAAVEGFLADHDRVLSARVKREVRNKLRTGLKNVRRV